MIQLKYLSWEKDEDGNLWTNVPVGGGFFIQVFKRRSGYTAHLDQTWQPPNSQEPPIKTWGSQGGHELDHLELLCILHKAETDIEELLHGTETEAAGTP
jgi:hypothetical protein